MMGELARAVSRARNGDQRAIKWLYDGHVDATWGLAFRILQRRDLSRDCVQEAFIKAFSSLDGLDDDARFGAWLYRITYRKALDLLRREHRHESEILEETHAAPDEHRDHLLGRRLVEAIDQLDDIYREVFVLYYLQDQKHREISMLLDIPEGSSKSRLFAARSYLRELLKDVAKP